MKGKSQGSRREAEAVDSLVASALRAFPQRMGLLEHLECLFLSGIFAEDLVFLPVGFLGDSGGLSSLARLCILRVPAQSHFPVMK